MGRHGAPRRAAGVDRELLGWGLFAAPAGALCLGFAGAGWLVAAAVATLVILVFGVVWVASVAADQRQDAEPSGAASGAADQGRPEMIDVRDL